MIDMKRAATDLAELAMLKYFPADDGARAGILALVCGMAETNEQVRWLVRRTVALYNEWPGPQELRAVLCSRFCPKDGINAYSAIFLDGVPPEHPLMPESSPQLALPPCAVATVDSEFDGAIQQLARAKSLPAAEIGTDRFTQQLNHVLTAPKDREEYIPRVLANPITQADIDRVLREQGRL